jgi:hypothetical protein
MIYLRNQRCKEIAVFSTLNIMRFENLKESKNIPVDERAIERRSGEDNPL